MFIMHVKRYYMMCPSIIRPLDIMIFAIAGICKIMGDSLNLPVNIILKIGNSCGFEGV